MHNPSVFDLLFDPSVGWLTPEAAQRLAAWRVNDELRQRIELLGQKANVELLSVDEDREYREYLDDEVISLMQAKARRLFQAGND